MALMSNFHVDTLMTVFFLSLTNLDFHITRIILKVSWGNETNIQQTLFDYSVAYSPVLDVVKIDRFVSNQRLHAIVLTSCSRPLDVSTITITEKPSVSSYNCFNLSTLHSPLLSSDRQVFIFRLIILLHERKLKRLLFGAWNCAVLCSTFLDDWWTRKATKN